MSPKRLLGAGKAAVQLAISAAAAYEVGQPITVRVAAVGLRDSSIRQSTVWLVQKIWLRPPQAHVGMWGAIPGSRAPHHTVTGAASRLGLAGDLAAGGRAESEIVLPNWANAPTGGAAPGRRIEYSLCAEVVLASGSKVRSEAGVRLVSGPSFYQQVEGTTRVHRSRRCELELVLPALRARPGETLAGTLRVLPRQPVQVRAISVFLIQRQSVAKRLHFFGSQDLAGDAEITEPSEYHFALQIPANSCPTLITPYLWVRWYVNAAVRYGRLRADRRGSEINIYTRRP
jgi:hypothetical protein